MSEDYQTQILVELAEIKTSAQKTEDHLRQLNGKVISNQDKINEQRNDLTQLFGHLSALLEKVQDAKLERQEEDEAIGDLRKDVNDVKFWKKYVIIGLSVLWGGLVVGTPFMLSYVKTVITNTVHDTLAIYNITVE